MTRRGVLLLLIALSAATLRAQDQLPVDVGHPVYRLIEICAIRGLIPRASATKPYTRREVREYLGAAKANAGSLTPAELAILDDACAEFQVREQTAELVMKEESEVRLGVSDTPRFHTVNGIDAGIVGSLGDAFSYDLNAGILLDKVDPEAFPPFELTKTWDGFHIWFDEAGSVVSDGTGPSPGISFRSLPALSLDVFDQTATIQFARIRREWGIGEGSLSLSSTARPILAVSGGIHPFPWANLSFLTGSLGDWRDPFGGQTMLSLHRLELFPFEWLYLSAWESVVWAKRMELIYLNPLMIYAIGQRILGDLDNIALGGEVAVTIPPYVRLYASLFIDEIALSPLDQLFTRANNQFAWQAGAKAAVPLVPWSLFIVQYTKIEPYCYTHYPQSLPQYVSPVDIGFANDGENIGYHLPPNSDELLVRFSASLAGWEAAVQYQLVRHGTGDHLLGQIEGDMDIPLIYDPASPYPPKSFLNDGIYEWLHIGRLRLSCAISQIRATAWAEYVFVNAADYGNIAGNDVVTSLIGLGVRLLIL